MARYNKMVRNAHIALGAALAAALGVGSCTNFSCYDTSAKKIVKEREEKQKSPLEEPALQEGISEQEKPESREQTRPPTPPATAPAMRAEEPDPAQERYDTVTDIIAPFSDYVILVRHTREDTYAITPHNAGTFNAILNARGDESRLEKLLATGPAARLQELVNESKHAIATYAAELPHTDLQAARNAWMSAYTRHGGAFPTQSDQEVQGIGNYKAIRAANQDLIQAAWDHWEDGVAENVSSVAERVGDSISSGLNYFARGGKAVASGTGRGLKRSWMK